MCLPEVSNTRNSRRGPVRLGNQIADEIAGIVLGLEADEVVLQEQRHQLLVVRQRGQHLRRGQRHVQEEADPVGVAEFSQRIGDRNEMIIMDPDDVVFGDDLCKLGREMLVHPEIAAQIAPREFGEIEPIMQDRP
jgi:membrane glycosyltransferase